MTETLAYGYSFERAQRELSDEYHHDWVRGFSKIFMLWMKLAYVTLKSASRVDIAAKDLL